jgi:hypothetical protein
MSFYTRGELKKRPLYEAKASAEKYHKKTASAKHHIFLSHSHKDSDLIEYVAEFLGRWADAIYIDWKDDSMPTVTSPETAARLKIKIRDTAKFILLATDNALASKWVPWELGVADLSNGMANVAILPVTDPPHTWTGSEYIGIYSRIIKSDDGEPGVFEPGQTRGASLTTWLTRP